MKNLVGRAIHAKLVARWVADLKRVRALFEKYGVRLTAGERRRLLHARPGGEQIAVRVADLAEAVGVGLTTPVAALRANVSLMRELRPVLESLRALSRLISDTRVQAEHEAWSGALPYYAALQRLAGTHPGIKDEIRPVVEFFAQAPRQAEAPPVAPEGPVGTV
jgi:hypothetical protein